MSVEGCNGAFRIVVVDTTSPYLPEVKSLWRQNSKTLGPFPDGAFDDYASRRTILGAIDPEGRCVGYLLYRISRNRASVVHLCVGRAYRNQSLARALVEHLRQATKDLHGIGLWCRRDYEASRVWPKLGFSARDERRGRGREGEYLTYWWLDHGHPTLFTSLPPGLAHRVRAVVDTDVLFDLQDEADPACEESKALLADWLAPELSLCVTNETLNEINRCMDRAERGRRRAFAQGFEILSSAPEPTEQAVKVLKALLSFEATDDESARQMARVIGAGCRFFITRSESLLAQGCRVYECFGLIIIRPHDLISRLDELLRQDEYQPERLVGSNLRLRRLRGEEVESLAERFVCYELGESKADFLRRLRGLAADPRSFEGFLVEATPNETLALAVYDRTLATELRIPALRVVPGPLSSTLARHLLCRSVLVSAREGRSLARVTDSPVGDAVSSALQDRAFVKIGDDGWVKPTLAATDTIQGLSRRLQSMMREYSGEATYFEGLCEWLNATSRAKTPRSPVDLEHVLWPTKVVDLEMPAYIIPIRPQWAKSLFDQGLAEQELFGVDPGLALSCENAYYRAARTHIVHAPGRILWYVSKDLRYSGSMAIRACSFIEEVVVGEPDELFRRFQRLGVYQWNDIRRAAEGSGSENVMAIRFGNTELFSTPIGWHLLQRIVDEEEGRQLQIQSPVRIEGRTFARLYRIGTGLQEGEG